MKKLTIVRHAKSSWKEIGMADFDRPLNKRGVKSARFMGDLLKGTDDVPEVIVCSPAHRTTTTCELLSEHMGFHGQVIFDESIYGSHYHNLADIAAQLNDQWGHVMLIGHNPGMSNLVEYYTDQGEYMVTCAMAFIDFDINTWQAASQGTGVLRKFDYPKNHQAFLDLLDA